MFRKIEREGKTKYGSFYSHSKAEKIINESGMDNGFKSVYTTVI